MPLNRIDVARIILICQQYQQRVRYGVLGAAISTRVGNPNALPQNYSQAIVSMINAYFNGPCHAASWVVGEDGFPSNYGNPPNDNFDPNWNPNTPLHEEVEKFLKWLDLTVPGWDTNPDLLSTYP